MEVSIKDNDNNIHNINVDTLQDGSDSQVIKLQLGDAGADGGYASRFNPIPVEMVGFFKRLFLVFGRLSFSTNSSLRVDCGGTSVAISGTPNFNGNMGLGDWGKASTAQQQSQQSFMMGIRQNFVKA